MTPPALLPSLVSFVMETWPSLPNSELQLAERAPDAEERMRWLDRDFGTTAFSLSKRVGSGLLQAERDGRALHVGLLVIEFPTCAALARAREAIARSGRSNFRLPVLTVFRSLSRDQALLLLMSETPLRSDVKRLFERLESFAPERATCRDST